jgi:cephalosporin hydroxylase
MARADDAPPAFDMLTALANQADAVSRHAAPMSAMKRLIELPALDWVEWLLLFAAAVEFRPDLIVELGRFHGSSTCALTEAAITLGGCLVRSYDVDSVQAYDTLTRPRLRPLVSPDWLGRQEIIHQDITQAPAEDMLRGGRRVLLFWDAHGPAVARHVLSRIAPLLAAREHLIVVHDVVDARYAPVEPEYVTTAGQMTCWRSHLMSYCEELDPIFDFASRNQVRLHTVGHSAWRRCPDAPATDVLTTAVRAIVGSTLDLFADSQRARFAYFSCGDRQSTRPLVFPPADDWDRGEDVGTPPGWAASATTVAVGLADLGQQMGTITPTAGGHVEVVTAPRAWAYAARMPLPRRAPDGATSGAVRVRAELLAGGPVGIGVVTADGKSFIDRRLVTVPAKVVEVFLHVPQLALAGDLVVQTWDRATSGTVRLESVTVIVRDSLPDGGGSR